MNSFASIYIPRMSTGWTEDAIREIMAIKSIGTVSHVDFTPINKKPGFGENVDSVVKSAFIHFSDPTIGSDNKYHFNPYKMPSGYDLWSVIGREGTYKLILPTGEYWICLKNKNPVRRTMMNIHQVVENARYLENLVMQQADEIKNLKETIAAQQKALEGVRDAVYQFIGGLYCHRTQSDMIQTHLDILFGRETSTNPVNCSIYPTTRQGDENRERIEKLEHFIEHHILPEATTRFCDYKDNDKTSQQDDELYNIKHCARCDIIDPIEYDVEEYERFLEDEEEEEERRQGRKDIIEGR